MATTSEVKFLNLENLQPNPFQPRDKIIEDDHFNELVESIKNHGVLE
ncbi:ParB N-terminal domain-containing protein, partial [bacterium]|nr:ParB N-terminal domain-containing protein [bacterium]